MIPLVNRRTCASLGFDLSIGAANNGAPHNHGSSMRYGAMLGFAVMRVMYMARIIAVLAAHFLGLSRGDIAIAPTYFAATVPAWRAPIMVAGKNVAVLIIFIAVSTSSTGFVIVAVLITVIIIPVVSPRARLVVIPVSVMALHVVAVSIIFVVVAPAMG